MLRKILWTLQGIRKELQSIRKELEIINLNIADKDL